MSVFLSSGNFTVLADYRELAEAAESMAQRKLRYMQLRRGREEWVRGMASSIEGREKEFDAKNALIQEEWARQDEEQRLRQSLRAQELKEQMEKAALDRVQDDMTGRMVKLQLARQAKVPSTEIYY